jgi:thioredoxin reductase
LFETSVPGIFVAGDVRHRSVTNGIAWQGKRILIGSENEVN